jgi:phosphatidylethanolamine N-methyltransferase
MRKLYGDSLRKDAGFVKVFKTIASKNARRVAGKHAPKIQKVAKEVIGTFDKVYEETADVVEDFLAKCKLIIIAIFAQSPMRFVAKPKISEVVQETKVLLQQSRERLVITWVRSRSCSTIRG